MNLSRPYHIELEEKELVIDCVKIFTSVIYRYFLNLRFSERDLCFAAHADKDVSFTLHSIVFSRFSDVLCLSTLKLHRLLASSDCSFLLRCVFEGLKAGAACERNTIIILTLLS